MNIICVNYAEIESKYVGEAPRRLLRLFEEAKKQNALLFFDEADTLLGKRLNNVDSTADQEANALKSQLLILLENYEGIVIFATNFIESYDTAFNSRIFKHIYFPLPDKNLRKMLIKKHIPPKAPLAFPLEGNFLEILSVLSEGFSGRDIKNATKEALITALVEGKIPIPFEIFKDAFVDYRNKLRTETKKNGESKEENKNLSYTLSLD